MLASFFFTSLMMAQLTPFVQREVYVIPRGYTGPVVIVFDEPEGREVIRGDDNTLIYRVPASGLLRLQGASPGGGLFDKRYYYEAGDGTRVEIPSYGPNKETLQVFAAEVGFAGGRSEDGPGKRWASFIVGVPSSGTDWWGLRREMVDRAVLGSGPEVTPK